MRKHRGFTLTEVLFALILMVTGVLAVLGLLASGSKAQQQARYRLYAGVVAMTLSDAVAQHDKMFSQRIHTIQANRDLGRAIVESAAYGSATRPDIENILAGGGENGVYPVPPEISARLDSADGIIRRVLDDGGQLYYADPRAIRGFATADGANPAYATAAPELQQLVFAVVGYPQQNLLPQHPAHQPMYELYPFPPQARNWPVANNAQRNTDNTTCHYQMINWEYFGRTRFASDYWPNGSISGCNPWQEGLVAYRNLVWFGAMPIQFKLMLGPNYTTGVPSGRKPRGVAITDPTWGIWGSKGSSFWAGADGAFTFNFKSSDYPNAGEPLAQRFGANATVKDCFLQIPVTPTLTTGISFKDFVNSWDPTDPSRYDALVLSAIGDLSSPDPKNWRYAELGTSNDPRLPSLQARRLYLWLALKLWHDVTSTDAELAGKNPLTDALWAADGSWPKPRWLHPARVLALSHVAHAAVMVTGVHGPLCEPKYTTDQPNGGLLANTSTSTLKYPSYYGIGNQEAVDVMSTTAKKLPGALRAELGADSTPVFTIDDPPTQADAADAAAARVAHENCLRWAIAYADGNPNDNIVPRPANRPTMLDRPLYAWDPFTAAGSAQRSNTPNTWAGAVATGHLPGYRVLPRIVLDLASSGAEVPKPGPGQFAGPLSATGNAWSNWENFYSRDSGAEPCLVGTQSTARRFWFTQPYQPQQRMRQLVFWAVDWKSYEDSESAPSAPIDASLLTMRMHSGTAAATLTPNIKSLDSLAAWRSFDPPEAAIAWWGRDRKVTAATAVFGAAGNATVNRFNSASGAMSRNRLLGSFREIVDGEGLSSLAGSFGADRNGNGTFDLGKVPPSTRMRASEVARFTVYDPIGWSHVRR